MASKWMKGILVLSVIVGVASATAVLGQTPDGVTPANEGVCDDLQWATPGLYGLCVAFCEAQDCEPDLLAEDPFVSCKPSSAKLLRVYNEKKGEDGPEMPCVSQAVCPCWTEDELIALPFPSDFTRCGVDGTDIIGRSNVDVWQIDATFVATWFEPDNSPSCFLQNPGAPLKYLPISAEEHAACEAQVAESGANRQFSCFLD